MKQNDFSCLRMALRPTPLQKLARLSTELGIELWLKRDDLTGLELSGNKVRKLEFLVAEAKEQEAEVLVTCGGEQSNHCRATAFAAVRAGLGCVLLLRCEDPSRPPAATGNILLDHLAGAEIRWISVEQWQERESLMEEIRVELGQHGQHAYLIPEGGSNAMGARGYVEAAEEIKTQLSGLDQGKDSSPDTAIVHACGSGGTTAGLVLGAARSHLEATVVAINVCDDEAYFRTKIGEICENYQQRFGAVGGYSLESLDIVDGYVGLGYAKSQPQELALIRRVARLEGVLLDPVYSGKAFYGMVEEVRKDKGRFGQRIVFIHTGGVFGLFPKAEQLMAAG